MKPNLHDSYRDETTHLLACSANAKRLLQAVVRDRAGVAGRSLDDVLTVLRLSLEAGEDPEVPRRP